HEARLEQTIQSLKREREIELQKRIAELETTHKAHLQQMIQSLEAQHKTKLQQTIADLETTHKKRVLELEETIKSLQSEHQGEIEKLRQELESKVVSGATLISSSEGQPETTEDSTSSQAGDRPKD
ncbi:MAG: hypothetical protein SXA11_02160, partial [Cyanobacteriota bacterium]|nr:hypothetical protein [Cyanobacteriota bacterium]